MKRKLVPAIQLTVGMGLILFILHRLHARGDMAEMTRAVRAAAGNWHWMAAGFLTFGGALLVCSGRWKLILRSQDLPMPFSRVLTLYFVGHFFNAFLLGSTGGDVVKAWYAAMETKHKRTETAATVFVDRTIGLVALLGMTVAVLLLRLQFFLASPFTRTVLAFLAVLALAAAVAIAVSFRRGMTCAAKADRGGAQRAGAVGHVLRAYDTFCSLAHHPRLLSGALLLSAANHAFALAGAWMFTKAVGAALPPMDCATAFLVINAVSAIPVTPGGLGTRETAAVYMLGTMGVEPAQAVTISLMVYGSATLWSLVGGAVYLVYSHRRGRVRDMPEATDARSP